MISVIIPVYNSKQNLDKCMSSVVQQSFFSWECLLIDDGSTDGSSKICDEWEAKDKRITAIHQINQGVSVARNKGIEKANGEWICFIDSDDWVDPFFLESLLSRAEGTDLVLSGQIREYPNKNKIVYQPQKTEVFTLDAEHANIFVELNRLFLLYAPHEKLYRTDIIKKQGLVFPSGCQYGEDLVFNYQYLEYVKTISSVATAHYHYRIGVNTLATIFRKNQFEEDYSQWKILELFYKQHGLWNKQAKDYLYQRLWGIIYDGLFLYPQLPCAKISYLKKILSIPEISFLSNCQTVFSCSRWIKCSILHRWYLPFFLKKCINKYKLK